MRLEPLRIRHFEDLLLKIYTIGYPGMGESIVLLLCNGGDVLFTVLTDCYCQSTSGEFYNHLETLFVRHGIKKIDTNDFVVSYIEATERVSLDSKRVAEEFPEAYRACQRVSDVKASVRVRLK